ncbi:hypothetical protein Syun_003577 [Stephania yunnanensis]|uniref:Uncharacterized protein n=1 Tax=Stephania yunnanensis TaxID=152371 RepID=A0AAP0L403_9MAGN
MLHPHRYLHSFCHLQIIFAANLSSNSADAPSHGLDPSVLSSLPTFPFSFSSSSSHLHHPQRPRLRYLPLRLPPFYERPLAPQMRLHFC